MSSSAQQFAATVLAAFRAAGNHTDQEVGEAGGPSTTTMTMLRKVAEGEGDMPSPRSDTLRKIDRAAGWRTGSARALWVDGADPELWPDSSGLARVFDDEERIKPRKVVRPGGFEGWVERLADRVLELEERMDILQAQVDVQRERDEQAFRSYLDSLTPEERAEELHAPDDIEVIDVGAEEPAEPPAPDPQG